MKKMERIFQIVLLVAFIFMCVKACTTSMFAKSIYELTDGNPPSLGEFQMLERTIEAISMVESQNQCGAYNQEEDALGCMQIRPIMLADYNRISGENRFMYEVRDRRIAYMIAKVIFLHYTKDIKNPTPQHYSFVWNGGGDAWKRVKRPKNDLKQKNLDSYWEKVKLYL